ARDRPHAERLPDHRRVPGRGRPRLGPEWPHRDRRLLGHPRGDADLVGRSTVSPRAKNREREYTAPRLYEIAFDMNRKGEVDFLVPCFKRFAGRAARRALDIACGTGPHLVRLAERGYQAAGLDLSARNIEYLGERLADKGAKGGSVGGGTNHLPPERP